jgi:hypothetical protein
MGFMGWMGKRGRRGPRIKNIALEFKKSGAKWCKVGELFVTLEPNSNKEV